MQLIDSHTHLYVEAFDEDRAAVLEKALQERVTTFLIPAIDAQYYDRMDALKTMAPERIHLMAGLHPTHVTETVAIELAVVYEKLSSGRYCAVGEIGIDLYWDQTFLDAQKEAFAQQIQWSIDFDLPIAIHCRDAFDEVFEVLERFDSQKIRGIFHCFTGTKEQALRAIEHNLLLGIGGVVTFKNGKIDRFLADIDLRHVVLETDAPYLAPTPHRGKRNESAYLPLVAEKLATLYQIPVTEVAEITSANIHRVFTLV